MLRKLYRILKPPDCLRINEYVQICLVSVSICLFLIIPTASYASVHSIQPVIGNIDSSTIADEIVTTSFDGGLYGWKADRTLLAGNWPVKFDGFVCARPALVDLDNNPKDLEILVPVCDYSGNYKLYGLQGGGNIIRGWVRELKFPVYSGPVAGKFEIDGKKTRIVFVGSRDGYLHAFHLDDWGPVSGWPKDLGQGKVVSVAVNDIDNDKANEVIVTSGGGRIAVCEYVYGKWSVVSDVNIESGIAAPASAADLDKDGISEVVVGSAGGTIYVWSFKKGKLEPTWSLATGDGILTSPVIGNFDPDKDLEILCFTNGGKLNILNASGSIIKSELMRNPEALSAEKKITTVGGNLGNLVFFSLHGSYVSNVYGGNPDASVTEWGMFSHIRQPYVIDLFADPDPFSPNGDGRKDSTSITSLIDSQGSYEASLGIYDANERIVRKLKEGAAQGSWRLAWDGRGDDTYNGGGPVSSEPYNILLQLESAMSDKISQLNTVVIDTTSPTFEIFSISPETVTPQDKSHFVFYPSEPAQLTISLINSEGKTYKSYSKYLEISVDSADVYSFEWDGSGDHNEIFSGTYTYIATLEDAAGNLSDPKQGILTIDIDAPFVNGVWAEPPVFSTKSDINKTAIHYAIPEDAAVSISVRNSQGSHVRTLSDRAIESAGANEIEWDGSDDSGKFLADGNYTFKIEAVDLKGNESATVENTVEIDNTPPSLLQISVLPSEFSPKGMSALTTLSFFVSEKANVDVNVFDSAGDLVKGVGLGNDLPPGSYTCDWDGTDNSASPVNDGNYRFIISAMDEAHNIRTGESVVVASSVPPSVMNASANPNLFTPGSGRSNSWTRISYTLSGGVGPVVIDVNILDASRGTVKRLIDDEITVPGNYSEFWYGDVDVRGGVGDANSDGLADGGEYIFEIVATDASGNQARAEGAVSIAQNPNVSTYVEPTLFSPARGRYATVFYNIDYSNLLSGRAQVWIEIKDQGGNTVYEFSDSVIQGSYTHIWRGENNQSGGTVADGTYQVKVRAQDPEGNNIIAYSNNVVVDSSGPVITINGANPNPFTPNVLESAYFDFSVSDAISTYYLDQVEIYDSGDTLVKTLSAGQLSWDGRVDGALGDSNGDGLADEGTYAFKIRATDEAGNESQAQGQVLVNRIILRLAEPANPVNPSHFSSVAVPSAAIAYTLGRTSVGPALIAASEVKMLGLAQAAQPIGCITVELRASDDVLVKTLVPNAADDGKRDAGTYQVSWDGRDEAGSNVPDGIYKVVITAHDLFGNPAEAQAELTYDLVLDTTPPEGSIVINDDKRCTNDRNVDLDIHANDALSNVVSMRVGGDGVFDTETEEDLAGSKTWALSEGDDGERFVYARFKDEAGNCSQVPISDSIILDRQPPVISGIHADPQYFSPGASIGVKDETNINYILDEPANVTIMRDDGEKIGSSTDPTSGAKLVTWSPGASVSEETYHYIILATDEAGNSSQTTGSDTVIIDNTAPELIVKASGPNPFDQLWQTFEATLEVSDICPSLYMDAQVLDAGGNFVGQIKSYSDGLIPTREISSFAWDGKDSDGFYMNEGKYKLRIRVADQAGNETAWNEISIEAVDDMRLTNTSIESTSPSLMVESGAVKLDWGDGSVDRPISSSVNVDSRTIGISGNYLREDGQSFVVDFPQQVTLNLSGVLSQGDDITASFIIKNLSGGQVYGRQFQNSWRDLQINQNNTVTLAAGTYSLYVSMDGRMSAGFFRSSLFFAVNYKNRKANLYTRRSSGGFPFVWAQTGPIDTENLKTGPTLLPEDIFAEFPYPAAKYHEGSVVHKTNSQNGEIFYWRGQVTGTIEREYSNNTCAHIQISSLTGDDKTTTRTFYIGYGQNVYVESHGSSGGGWRSDHHLVDPNGVEIWQAHSPGHGQYIYLREGTYTLRTEASVWGGGSVDLGTKASFHYKTVSSTVEWSAPVRITNNPSSSEGPSICADGSDNAYIAWQDKRDGNWEIYFQKIPLEFEPLKNFKPAIGMSSFSVQSIQPTNLIIQAVYLTPECVSPKAGTVVKILRPEFKWYGLNGVMDYRIECAKASDEASLSNTMDYFNTIISYDQAQADRPLGVFSIPEHQTGLDENNSDFNSEPFWYWRVKAISSEGTVTSEVASFTISLSVSISGVINYPNPFNPNKERTKIRYKLGREANEVTVRIYDITGALVKELEGETRSEGSSIWDKYNEVEWDGRNGRGDMVRNGVYPFEVAVSSAGKHVSARGKIVVLK